MKKNKFQSLSRILVFVFVISFLTSMVSGAPVTNLYPEDYSWRGGIELETKIIDSNGKLLQKEINYWNTYYPFRDPSDVSETSIPQELNHISKANIGFRYSVVKLYPGYDVTAGKLQASLALVPYLQAKKIFVYDEADAIMENGNYLGSGVKYTYDKFGNIKKQENFGLMRNGANKKTFYKTFESRDIYNIDEDYDSTPGDNPLQDIQTSVTNFQGSLGVVDERIIDNSETEITYEYERSPLYQHNSNLGSVPYTSDIKGVYELMNWVDLPYQTITTDILGRQIQNSKYNYEDVPDYFADCGASQQEEEAFCFDYNFNCQELLAAKVSVPTNEYNILNRCGDEGMNVCVRRAVAGAKSFPNVGEGVERLFGGSFKSSSGARYDNCGNVVFSGANTPFIHPSQEGGDTFSTSFRFVQIEYDDEFKASPVRTIQTPISQNTYFDVTNYSNYSEYEYELLNYEYSSFPVEKNVVVQGYGYVTQLTNENGLVTNYGYDNLGRIIKVAVSPDSLSDPTMEFEYFLDQRKVKDIRKIDANKYVESWHFYDMAGRHVQTQTWDADSNGIIFTLSEYDVLGRVVRQIKPVFQSVSVEYVFGDVKSHGELYPLPLFMNFIYDALNRNTRTDNFDDTYVLQDYQIVGDSNPYTTYTVQDEKFRTRTFTSDSRGNLAFVKIPIPVV